MVKTPCSNARGVNLIPGREAKIRTRCAAKKGGKKKRYHSKPKQTILPLKTTSKLKIKKEIALDKINLKHCQKPARQRARNSALDHNRAGLRIRD